MKEDNRFIYDSKYSGKTEVELSLAQYANNGRLYLGLISYRDGDPEPFADVTVNIDAPVPDYCGYLDTNNLSKVEKFVTENDLGEFTGIMGQSGYCQYPLYLFNVEKLRELFPSEMEVYEQSIGAVREEPKQDRSR